MTSYPFLPPVPITSIGDVAAVGDEIIRRARAELPLVSWPYLAIEDLFLVAAMGEALSPAAAFAMATAYLGHRVSGGDYAETTVEKLGSLIARFVRYVESRYDITDVRDLTAHHADAWIRAPRLGSESRTAAERTRDNRRWALDLFFRTLRGLNLYDGDPLLDAERVTRPAFCTRPLLDAELERCRKHARSGLNDTLGPARVALAESMATVAEIANALVADYDPAGQRVWLNGTGARLTGRWVNVLPWAANAIERRIAALDSPDSMALLVRTGSADRAGEVISMALRRVLDSAGLRPDPRVKPSSFRAWGGRRLYDETGDIEDVARRLGVARLDSARGLIGLADPEPDTPPPHRRSS